MLELMDYDDDLSFEDFDDLDGLDELAFGGAIGGALGGKAGSWGAGYLYDGAANVLKNYGNSRGKRLGKWMSSSSGARDLATTVGGAAGGFLGGAAGTAIPWFESEDEYEAENIDDMEALMEIALEGDSEDAEEAIDGMVMRAFGPIRAAANMRKIMAAVRQKVASLVARARRDPRYQAAARVAPTVLRRTAVKLLKMVAAGRQVTVEIALRVFAGELARVLQSSNSRRRTVQTSRARASRSLARHRATARMY